MTLSEDYTQRFGGLGRLYGVAALPRLSAAHVCVVGVGGVGSWVVEGLVRSGIGAITMIDLDDVCLTNVNRQLPALDGNIGRPKVEALTERVKLISPGCAVTIRHEYFTAKTAAQLLSVKFDWVVDCVDLMSNKALLIAECTQRDQPVVTVGAAGGRRDATKIRVSDFGDSHGDELLRQVRKKLRRDYGFAKGEGNYYGIPCVSTQEQPVFPWADGTCSTEPEEGSNLRLDCATGFGTAVFITGAFGFAAAGEVVRRVALRIGREPAGGRAVYPEAVSQPRDKNWHARCGGERMRRILAANYDQGMLLAPSIEDWIGPRHAARFIREFVAALDLRALGLDRLERAEGGVAYAPGLLLQAWLYGYLRKIRSSRGLENACREEMGFVWLTGNHRPDHHALWRFWHEHHAGIRALFQQSVKVALELDLVGLAVQALDGTKIAAASSGRGGFDRTHLTKLLVRLEEQVAEREKQIATAAAGVPDEELPPLVRLREQVRTALAQVESGQSKHAHPLEPEAARMACEGRNRFGYNAQVVVDAKAQIIVAQEITTAPNDAQQLVPMVRAAQTNCQTDAANAPLTLADGGYASGAQLATAAQDGYPVLTPPPPTWRDTSDPYHVAHFRHEPSRQVVVCPQGRELHYKGMRQKDGREVAIYRHAAACKDCPVRAECTSDRQGRAIYIAAEHAVVAAAHQRWQQPATRELYGLRAPTVEPVFAQVKQQMGFRRWTVRGLENVRTQWSLLTTTWNLRVLLRHWRGGTNGSSPAPGRPSGPCGPSDNIPVSGLLYRIAASLSLPSACLTLRLIPSSAAP